MKSKALTIFTLLAVVHHFALGQGPGGGSEPRGLRLKCDGVSPGYTLFAPMSSDTTYLIDLKDGRFAPGGVRSCPAPGCTCSTTATSSRRQRSGILSV